MSKEYIIPIFLPHGGCKKRCVFCNEYSATGFGVFPNEKQLDEIFEKYINYFPEKENIYIAFYGSTFTGLDDDKIKYYLDYAQNKINKNLAKGIRFSTSPEEISKSKIDILKKYDINLLELGIQSFDDKVLKMSNRPHNLEDVKNAIDILEKENISFGLHLMTGLPGSNYNIEKYSVENAIKTDAKTLRIHPSVVLRNTLLEKKYNNSEYQPESLEEAVKKVAEFTRMIEKNGKTVIRYGLCLYGDQIHNVIAGPYHQSFGDLVKTEIMKNIINKLNEEIYVPKKLKPLFLGYKKSNQDIIHKKQIHFYDGNRIKIKNEKYSFEEFKKKYI